jgi:hypothetical protein
VYLLESPESEQTIELFGEIPLQPEQSSFQPPQIEVREVDKLGARLKVFRQSEVQVSIGESKGWTAIEQPLGRFEANHGRLIAALHGGSPATPPPQISLVPNRPRVSGQSLVHVQQTDNEWSWEADLDLEIADGLLDSLALILPAELPENIQIFPEMGHDFEAGRAQQRRLILKPPLAATGSLQVRLRGPLTSSNEGIAAPDIMLEDFSDVRRYVLLDRGAVENQFDWETAGLTAMDEASREELPAHWRARTGGWYKASTARYQAIAHARHSSEDISEVLLTDVRGALLGRRLKITAESIVLPMHGSPLRFSLPPDCRLLETRVEGITVQPIASGLRSWEVASISDALPFHLTITYDTFAPVGQNTALHLTAPGFTAARSGQFLFSISGAGSSVGAMDQDVTLGGNRDEKGVSICGPGEADLVRLQALAQAAEEITAAQDGSIPPICLSEIFARFESKFLAVNRALQKTVESGEADESLLQQAATSLDELRKARLRLEHSGLTLPDIANEVPIQDDRAASNEQAVCHLMGGDAPEFTVQSPYIAPVTNTAPSVLAILLLASAAALVVMPTTWINQHWLVGRVSFQLAVIGFLWWLLAPMGWLGWLLILVAVFGLLRTSPQAPVRERGSSLLRATSAN